MMVVTMLRGVSTSCRAAQCQLRSSCRQHARVVSRTSASIESAWSLSTSPPPSCSSPFGLRGVGCSVKLTSFDNSKNGSDFLFLVCRRTLCDPAERLPDGGDTSPRALLILSPPAFLVTHARCLEKYQVGVCFFSPSMRVISEEWAVPDGCGMTIRESRVCLSWPLRRLRIRVPVVSFLLSLAIFRSGLGQRMPERASTTGDLLSPSIPSRTRYRRCF